VGEKRVSNEANPLLFDEHELIPWKREWQNMPAFDIQDLAPKFQVIISFSCAADVEDFSRVIGQPLKASNGRQLQSLWFPSQEIGQIINKRYIRRLY
jgi:hypothetical protein